MKFLPRRWLRILVIAVIGLLAAEVIILLSNQNSVNLRTTRIHHDDSSSGPWLVMRVENTHLTPIRILGLSNENEIPWVAYQIERDLQNGTKDSWFNGWCTSNYNIVIPPLSSREIRIPIPDAPKDKPEINRWEIQLFGESTSLLSWISPFAETSSSPLVGHVTASVILAAQSVRLRTLGTMRRRRMAAR